MSTYIKDVGSKLWRSLSEGLGEPVTKFNFQAVLKRHRHKAAQSTATASGSATLSPGQDWGEAVDASHFYGRAAELESLSQWLTVNNAAWLQF